MGHRAEVEGMDRQPPSPDYFVAGHKVSFHPLPGPQLHRRLRAELLSLCNCNSILSKTYGFRRRQVGVGGVGVGWGFGMEML